MINLSRATGPTALLDVAFLDGNILKAFKLAGIRRRLRKSEVSDAIDRAEAYVGGSRKAQLRAQKGRPLSERERRLMVGELLYKIGESESALTACILPEVESMLREEQFVDAKMTLDDVLEAEPDCAQAQQLLERIPADLV
jgi:hypothetical protein